jgi:tetratricopeptide (TPR) repeat protein
VDDKQKEILAVLDKLQQMNEDNFDRLSEQIGTQSAQLQVLMANSNRRLTDLVDLLRILPIQVADLVGVQLVDMRKWMEQRLKLTDNKIAALQTSGQKGNKELEIKFNLTDANKAFYDGDYSGARKLYEAVLASETFNVEALTAMGNICLQRPQPDYDGALNYYDKALSIEPKNASLLVWKGQALYGRKNPISALNCMDRALKETPGYADALIGEGIILTGFAKDTEIARGRAAAQDFYSQAIENFKSVLNVEPDNFYAIFNMALVFEYQGRSEDAMSCLEKAPLEKVPNVEGLYQCGLLFERQRDYEKAGRYYDRILSIKPKHLNANRKLAFALLMLGYVDKALYAYKQSADIDPNIVSETRTEFFVCMAISDNDTGEMTKLVEDLGTSDPMNMYIASRLEAILGQESKALDLMDKVLILDPRFEKLALHDRFFEKLRTDPRFQSLSKKTAH